MTDAGDHLDPSPVIEGADATAKTALNTVHVLRNEQLRDYIPDDILERYEIHSYRHAADILAKSFPDEFAEILDALRRFKITVADLRKKGGNESEMPKKLSAILEPQGWKQMKLQGDLILKKIARYGKSKEEHVEDTIEFESFIDSHYIDYVKGRVAFDMEWNSKDQTFDRDLYAFSTFAEWNLVSVGVILTRGSELRTMPEGLGNGDDGKPIKDKYGASTTWMGKLLPRLDAGRNGSCPVLAVGIRPAVIEDLAEHLNPVTTPASVEGDADE